MGSKICMNEVCRATTSSEWKKGWALKSGGFAFLCYSCGSAYENSIFCETFHIEESGWRECRICGKRIHCGCIASRYLHEYMDVGGVACINCAQHLEISSMPPMQIHAADIRNGAYVPNGVRDVHHMSLDHRINENNFSNGGLLMLSKTMEANESGQIFQTRQDNILEQLRRDENVLPSGEGSVHFPGLAQQSVGTTAFTKPPLNFLSSALGTSSSTSPFTGGAVEGREQNKGSFQQGQRTRHILPKPPKSSVSSGSETNKGNNSQTRVARPPVEGRGRNQLLPRYWPRITDQELQQISGDLKSAVEPLFEKVLSASDAGRIGRLVLPKACAEAYFPPINQSEGVAIRIQDVKGKEWTFQFRFWPNNNSRMYVLEGVTPCIQNMQLQAGDTVTFSRINPGGQLVIGCRKATNNDVQDPQAPPPPNGESHGESSLSGFTENLHPNGAKSSDDSKQREKKTRNIKSKRLLMHNDDALELRITWEEAQDLFRVPPAAEPRIIMVESVEFEEYDEPPIFGKQTIFTSRSSGEQDQWAQCDSCSKWRRLPMHVLLPASWTCSENMWDPNRNSCSASDDISPSDLDAILRISKDLKRRRIMENKTSEEHEPSGLDALATAAVLGDNISEIGESSVGATTRHPRHRPGCTCIVCIQPPSGKGKHHPSCKCTVCSTVKRRFRTLMAKKKKRQSEREAEIAQMEQDQAHSSLALEKEDTAGDALLSLNHSGNGRLRRGNDMEHAEMSKGQLDLNSHPGREDEMLAVAAGMSMTSLINAASLPMEMYFDHNGLSNLGQRSQNVGAREGHFGDDGGMGSGDGEQENRSEDG